MKRIFLLCLLFPVSVCAQVSDDFSDGNFSSSPRWVGDSLQFEVNTAGQLHLKSQGSDTSVLVTRCSSFSSVEWRFWMKLSFNTSSNNYARVYLASDTLDLTAPMDGWYVQAGGSDDSLFVIRQRGTELTREYGFHSYKMSHSTNTLRIRIRCDETGEWEVAMDTTGGTGYYVDGRFRDNPAGAMRWFGIFCRYTSSNSAKFYFDDFYAGPIIRDTVPPGIISTEIPDSKTISIAFSEPVDKEQAATAANYRLIPGDIFPDTLITDASQPAVTLVYRDPLPEGADMSLQVRNIADLAGNRMNDTLIPVCYYRAKAFDVMINEILADPEPSAGLPDGEFVELYNRTGFHINLKGWTFSYGNAVKTFPSVTINPQGYLLIARESLYLNYGSCVLLFTSSSSLSNEGSALTLRDPQSHVIHTVSYSPEWFGDSFKKEGGWSLEMTDPENPCGCSENWGPSQATKGGTPGKENSGRKSNPDPEPPVLTRALIVDSTTIEARFSEEMDSLTLAGNTGWTVAAPGQMFHPAKVELIPPGYAAIRLSFAEPFKGGIQYQLYVPEGLADCSGNLCDTAKPARLAYPDSVALHDVVINEILSNPASGGSRFVELYNRSEKIIDLQDLIMTSRDTVAWYQSGTISLFSSGFLLFPGEYAALTINPDDVATRYHSPAKQAIVGVADFPTLDDDSGTVIIARKDNLAMIDRVRYRPGMHFPLLASTEGVSLERTSPDMPSDAEDNWHSASEASGFATPGYRNSHFVAPEGEGIVISPPVFSPDNDGYDDLLTIFIGENDPGFTVTIEVYDSKGTVVKTLANNVLSGSREMFTWDGATGTGRRASYGIYVIMVELTRPDGTVKRYKKTAVLGGRL